MYRNIETQDNKKCTLIVVITKRNYISMLVKRYRPDEKDCFFLRILND